MIVVIDVIAVIAVIAYSEVDLPDDSSVWI